MRAPLALAFAMPDLTRARMIRNSSSAKTPDICIKAFVMNRMSGLIELFDVDIYFCLICRKISVSVRNIGMKAFWVGMMDLNRFI